jgi:hypothetical protein
MDSSCGRVRHEFCEMIRKTRMKRSNMDGRRTLHWSLPMPSTMPRICCSITACSHTQAAASTASVLMLPNIRINRDKGVCSCLRAFMRANSLGLA